MKTSEVVHAWGRILRGHLPSLSIEVTRECPLTCAGCYAYGDDHLGVGQGLTGIADFKGQALIDGILDAVDRYKPLHLSLVGGEPLVRYRELTELLPVLEARGVHTQVVTSAVRPIPEEWRRIQKLNLVVSVDGLQPEHDARRAPATYDRVEQHVSGHQVTIHCTVTRQMLQRETYLDEFLEYWAAKPEVRKVWFSIYTPQLGEEAAEILLPAERAWVIDRLDDLRHRYPKLEAPKGMLDGYRQPPVDPDDCIFASTTRTLTADLHQEIMPCQFGGSPDCAQCGCVASAGLTAVGRHRLPYIGLRVGAIYRASARFGSWMRNHSRSATPPPPPSVQTPKSASVAS